VYKQLITPTPDIWCRPGWCLEYVRKTFGQPARYDSATDAWEASTSKHQDRQFPEGMAVPVWYGLHKEPAGHVVLRMPDGSCYSTSDLTNTPHHHPSLAHLEEYYAYYGMPLSYRGWTEDMAGTRVIAWDGINVEGTITKPTTSTTKPEETRMAGVPIPANQAEDIAKRAAELVVEMLNGKILINPVQAESIVKATTSRTVDGVDARNTGKLIDRGQADDIARAAARYSEEGK
jgi:hypothetical protein